MKKILTVILVSLLTLGCLTGCQTSPTSQPTVNPSQVEMQKICELAVMKCYYHNVAKYNQENASQFLFWSKDKKFWVEYDVAVTLGIDASLVHFSQNGDTITITIPPAEIQEFQVISESLTEDSYIVETGSAKITAEDETTAFATSQEGLKKSISTDKTLLAQAQQRAQLLLEEYIHNLGEAVGQTPNVEWEYLEAQETPESADTSE